MTSAPNTAFEYCLEEQVIPNAHVARYDLRKIRAFINASEAVCALTMRRFRTKFAKARLSERAVMAYYGLAENSLAVTHRGRRSIWVSRQQLAAPNATLCSVGDAAKDAVEIFSCGRQIGGTQVRVCDGGPSKPVGPGRVGDVYFRGSSAMAGYWSPGADPDRPKRVASWIPTGDLGAIVDDELYILGRLSDRLVVGGKNIYAEDVEETARRELGVQPRYGVAAIHSGRIGSDGITILVETRARASVCGLGDAHARIANHCGVAIEELALVPVGAVARSSSGKIARQKTRQKWSKGTVHAVASYRPDSLSLHELISSIYEGAEGSSTLEELGVDSMRLVALGRELERAMWGTRPKTTEARVDLRQLQNLCRDDLERLAAGSNVPSSVLSKHIEDGRVKACGQDRCLMMSDVSQGSGYRPRRDREKGEAREILLTGGTGFLGSFILETLLDHVRAPIHVIARGNSPTAAYRRVLRALRNTGRDSVEPGRLHVYCGDLAKPRLGLSSTHWDCLAATCETVIHCGAEVDYTRTYRQMRPANVTGTRQVLEFCNAGPEKQLHHISTTFVFGFAEMTLAREEDCNPSGEALTFGYPQSKWVSEMLVRDARDRGLAATIYRPSLIGAARNGYCVEEDIFTRLLVFMVRSGLGVSAPNQFSLVPVDIAGENIAKIALFGESAGSTIHVTSFAVHSIDDVVKVLNERYSYGIECLQLPEFVGAVANRGAASDAIYPLVPFLVSNHRNIAAIAGKRYENRNYAEALSVVGRGAQDRSLAETIAGMVEWLVARNMIPEPTRTARSKGSGL